MFQSLAGRRYIFAVGYVRKETRCWRLYGAGATTGLIATDLRALAAKEVVIQKKLPSRIRAEHRMLAWSLGPDRWKSKYYDRQKLVELINVYAGG